MRVLSISIWVPLLAIVMRIASTPTANLSYLLLAGYALTGRMQTIYALALSCLFAMLSRGIGSEASMAAVGRYVLIFAAALSALLSLPLLVHSSWVLTKRDWLPGDFEPSTGFWPDHGAVVCMGRLRA